jgi:predicted NAD/FAD-dependent oxidoreductase
VLTADLSTVTGFNFADIQHIHLECDPGSFQTGTYDLNFKDLVVAVPEPASLTLLALDAIGFVIARRRVR